MMNFFARLSRLLPLREELPEVAFNRVIDDRQRHYLDLKMAVAKILFLRNKLEGDLLERRAEVARVHSEARSAARNGYDRRALVLLERMKSLKSRLADAEEQVEEIKREASAATEDMARINESIRDLEREKRESLAKLTSAEFRKKLRRMLDETEQEDRRLERVRTMVARASAEASLDRDMDDPAELTDASARIELARMKARLLPA